MKYTVVFRGSHPVYKYRIRNNEGKYACVLLDDGTPMFRSWQQASEAWAYVDKHMAHDEEKGRNHWAEDPADKPYIGGGGRILMRHQPPTAGSYKPAHGGYPDASSTHGHYGTRTGRSTGPAFMEEVQRKLVGGAFDSFCRNAAEPLAWPVIDDDSNEEPFTFPDQVIVVALVSEGTLGSLLRSKLLFPNL